MVLKLVNFRQQMTFEMRCRRMMEKISWTDRVRNDDVLQRVNKMEEG